MKLISLLRQEFCHLQSELGTREEVLAELISRMAAAEIGVSRQEIQDAVFERDRLGSTIVGSGLAIPHARLSNLNNLQIGICIPRRPFICENQPIKLLILLLAPAGSSNTYLKTLTCFSKVVMDERLYQRLLPASSFADLCAVLRDQLIEPALEVRDILSEDFLHITADSSVKDLIDTFYWEKSSYIPVLDATGNFIGEVTGFNLFEAGIPGHVRLMENLRFMKNFEPLEDLLKRENQLKVRDIMVKPAITIPPEASIIELVFLMVQHRRVSIPVVDAGGVLCGVVSQVDLIAKVMRV